MPKGITTGYEYARGGRRGAVDNRATAVKGEGCNCTTTKYQSPSCLRDHVEND